MPDNKKIKPIAPNSPDKQGVLAQHRQILAEALEHDAKILVDERQRELALFARECK